MRKDDRTVKYGVTTPDLTLEVWIFQHRVTAGRRVGFNPSLQVINQCLSNFFRYIYFEVGKYTKLYKNSKRVAGPHSLDFLEPI